MLQVTSEIQIPLSEIHFSYARSSGPGGQNVNKVNSKAVLRWSVSSSPSLTPDLRAQLISRLGSQLTQDGELVISSDRFRDQSRNRQDCIEKLRALLASVSFVPRKRKKTRPSHSRIRKNKEAKQKHSAKKRNRRLSGRSYSDG
jgi:ribosome-associated protein